MTPAACGARVPFLMVQHLTSSSPAVKKWTRFKVVYPTLMILLMLEIDPSFSQKALRASTSVPHSSTTLDS
jgi:hypothetical protein